MTWQVMDAASAGGHHVAMIDQSKTAWIQQVMPLCATLGIEAEQVEREGVVLSLSWRPELCTSGGLLHGGVLMALADSAGATCAFLNLPEGATGTTTIQSATNFLGKVTSGRITAEATILHAGRTTIVVETELRDDEGRRVGKVSQTQAVLRSPAG